MKGWVDLDGWKHTFASPKEVTHLSTNRARCRLTSLISPTSLTITPCHQSVLPAGLPFEYGTFSFIYTGCISVQQKCTQFVCPSVRPYISSLCVRQSFVYIYNRALTGSRASLVSHAVAHLVLAAHAVAVRGRIYKELHATRLFLATRFTFINSKCGQGPSCQGS